ncbi:hypothetical protein AVEN_253524-1 [Araneus ventricosus]|uniref:Uncharacterized protein n=1 Tax=Araneus ventricosus TaxID=182803 RepID=A0A4Y2BVP6_ARAVE|nr:hypothetical protein AVEN_253524-1 [Araneus ventricosus]
MTKLVSIHKRCRGRSKLQEMRLGARAGRALKRDRWGLETLFISPLHPHYLGTRGTPPNCELSLVSPSTKKRNKLTGGCLCETAAGIEERRLAYLIQL